MKKLTPREALDKVADVVLTHRAQPKSEAAKKRAEKQPPKRQRKSRESSI